MNTLYYSGKDEPITDIASYTLSQRKYIDIIPKDRQNFDICTLLDFIDSNRKKYLR